jgi:hypothetical protein
MRRIIDEEHSQGSPEHALAELVRATPRLESAPFQKQRILAGVTRSASAKRRGPWPAIATAVSILAGATLAAAAVGHFRAPPRPAPSVASTAASVVPVPAPPRVETPSEVSAADTADHGLDLPPTPTANTTPERPSARLRATAPFKDGEDPAPVLEGIRALRYNGDPARAGVLLAQYLKAHPHGVLAEDASALSIEAALARHDTRAAAELSRRYLAQFPSGRYRAFALQSAQTTGP